MAKFKAILLLLAVAQCIFAGPIFDDEFEFRQDSEENPFSIIRPAYRLPTGVVPEEYQIKLTPYMREVDFDKRFTFDGEVRMVVKAIEANLTEIVLHSHNLVYEKVPVMATNPDGVNITRVTYDKEYDFMELRLNKVMEQNQTYIITFNYNGTLRDDMTGFYRSSYQEGNVTKWLATTKFQPVHARKAFPCFDEPRFKAIFKLSIVCPPKMTCISNMPVSREVTPNLNRFEATPKMSTYLLAFIVSNFEKTVSSVEDNFAIWARHGVQNQTRYALEVGAKQVAEMEKYTGLEYYNLSSTMKMKMDQAAIPDFASGAMENWGLITYKEAFLLVDDVQTTTGYKLRVSNILAHEIVHMWFGNLVTCGWWSATWLNEGFARYFQYYLTSKVEPGFHIEKHFITFHVHLAMSVDSSSKSLPLTNPNVFSPAEIAGQFTTISYSKGAAVLRMIEHWLGSATFQAGLNIYLKKKSYDFAMPEDLFDALQIASNMSNSIATYNHTVENVFKSWTTKSGYPVLEVYKESNSAVTIKQSRFLLNGEPASGDLYMIPITFTTPKTLNFNDTKPLFIMKDKTMIIAHNSPDWILFNIQQTGYYRVKYSDELYGWIIKAFSDDDANRKAVHEFNRAQLVDDAFNFAKESMMSYGKLFEIIQFLENDLDFTPWSAAFNGINLLRPRFMHFDSLTENFDMHISKLMVNLIKDLKFEVETNDDHLRKLFRTQTMTLACAMGHEECVNKSIEYYNKWMESENYTIKADHREVVYCNGLRHGGTSQFDMLMEKYLEENVVNEKYVILVALGCTRNASRIEEYLQYSINSTGDIIKAQDKMMAFNSALSGNKENVGVVYNYFIKHLSDFRREYGSSNIPTMMNNMAAQMNTVQLKTFKDFLNAANTTVISAAEKTSGLNSIQSAENTIKWVESKEEDIKSWINSKYNSASGFSASIVLLITMIFSVLFNQ